MNTLIKIIIATIVIIIFSLAFCQNAISREKATKIWNDRNDCWQSAIGDKELKSCLK